MFKKNVDIKFQIKRFHNISNMAAPMLTTLNNLKSTLYYYYPCTGLAILIGKDKARFVFLTLGNRLVFCHFVVTQCPKHKKLARTGKIESFSEKECQIFILFRLYSKKKVLLLDCRANTRIDNRKWSRVHSFGRYEMYIPVYAVINSEYNDICSHL